MSLSQILCPLNLLVLLPPSCFLLVKVNILIFKVKFKCPVMHLALRNVLVKRVQMCGQKQTCSQSYGLLWQSMTVHVSQFRVRTSFWTFSLSSHSLFKLVHHPTLNMFLKGQDNFLQQVACQQICIHLKRNLNQDPVCHSRVAVLSLPSFISLSVSATDNCPPHISPWQIGTCWYPGVDLVASLLDNCVKLFKCVWENLTNVCRETGALESHLSGKREREKSNANGALYRPIFPLSILLTLTYIHTNTHHPAADQRPYQSRFHKLPKRLHWL